MKTTMFEPKNDGIDHINVYSGGATELGRLLTNFAHTPFENEYGKFESVEGFWYWLKTLLLDTAWNDEQLKKIKNLKTSYGFIAKKIGRELLSDKMNEADKIGLKEEFKEDILEAIRCKLRQNKYICKILKESSLPFAHYYYYGNVDKNPKIYYLPQYQWIIDELELCRKKLKEA